MTSTDASIPAVSPAVLPLSEEELKRWMVNYISQLLSLDKDSIRTGDHFDSFGMDSIEAVVMAGVMEEEFSTEIEPTLFFEYPSIDLFAAANCRRD